MAKSDRLLGGAFAGALLALMLDFIFRRTHGWLEQRIKRKELQA